MTSVYPLESLTQYLDYNIRLWHGLNTELFMTFGIIIVGTFLYVTIKHWGRIYRLFPEKWSFDALYNYSLEKIESSSSSITKKYMTGSLRHYVTYIMLFFVMTTGGYFIYSGAFTFDSSQNAAISPFVWMITIVMAVAAIVILFVKTRLSAILFNGVLGFSIAILFVLFRAPDLALTQLVVETVTTALFLLCFYFLPKWTKETNTSRINWVNLGIAIAVGAVFTVVALSVHSGKLFDSISTYFENAYELVGGMNIVNAILGDFRAFDTMLEIIVLFIAGIGVYAIIKVGSKKGSENIED